MEQQKPKHPKKLSVPDTCHCIFDQQSSSYVGILTFINISDSILHFQILNSFAHYLQFQETKRMLKPYENFNTKFKIKLVNQILPKQQFIYLSWSSKQANQKCTIKGSNINKINLEFDQEIMEDQQIENILNMQSQQMFKAAQKQFNEGNFTSAYNLYEQCFIFYRKNYKGLLGMAMAKTETGDYAKALYFLDLYILGRPNESAEALILKGQILESFVKDSKGIQKYDYLRTATHIYEQLLREAEKMKKGSKIRCEKGLERVKLVHEYSHKQECDYHFVSIVQNAIKDYQSQDTLKEYFKDQKQFKNYLTKLLQNEEKDMIETPEYAIDPIQYEIYKDPVITPTGHSYESQFMKNFFKQHGPKDPHTRQYLHPNSLIQNITLKILVRNNPELPKWLKYEEQHSTF